MPTSKRSRAKPPSTPLDPTTAWAKAVVAGKIISGELVCHAAERHLRDMRDGPKRGLFWRPERATHALDFFPAVLTITEGAMVGLPFTLLPWHVFVVGSLFGWRTAGGRMRFRSGWLETGKGQAKALALDTPIATPSGWTTMGALRAGDEVFDDQGATCRVTQAHPIVTRQDCYRLSFDDSTEIVANAGHLWRTEMRKSGNSGHGAATKGIPLAHRGAWRDGIRTTEEIAATLTYKNGAYASANHSIALAGALDLPERDLPVDPYVLGAWLGDGDSDGARITVGEQDAEATAAIMAACGVTLSRQHGHACRYGMRIGDRWGSRKTSLSSRLRALGVFGNKHIPGAYLRASRDQRLAMLQGLMDTDGTIGADGQCCFTVTNKNLADGAAEVALSLGLKATVGTERARLYGRDCGAVYRLRFYAPETLPVFRLQRKLDKQKARHARRRLSADRRIIACERIDSVPVRCITVDSPTSMFLAGREMVPTHNSPLMAAIGLYMMGWYGISRARAYAIGQDRNTANVLFKDAVAMCRATIPGQEDGDSLEGRGEVIIRGEFDNAWKIERPADNGQNSIFQSLANGEAISGPRPTLVAADEIHEFKSASPIETWKEAIAKMPGDALMLLGTNTPAVNQIVGTSYSEFYQRVARGDFSDDEAFSFIARTDPSDHETVFENEACWAKALPALGITFPIENIRGRVNTAKALISTALSVKRLYFGIPVGSAEYWISEPAWRAVQKPVDAKAMKGKPCWLSLDLSKKNDLTALTATWRGDDNHLWSKTWYWTAREGLEDRAIRDVAPYLEYVEAGLLTAVPGPVIDYSFVVARVAELVAEQDVKALAFDPAFIAEFQAACADAGFAAWVWTGPDGETGDGLMMMRHAQGKRVSIGDRALTEIQLCMPHSITKLEDAILHERITIDASKVTDLCSMNAALDEDGQGNRCFAKERSRGRIDGLVTIAMGVGASDGTPAVESAYARRGLLFV